ncbi:MAG: hypothetical protein FJ086_18405, partial [Deltaproteobacteria bacterium]|nr:hypothetical protein [Deltaproteobacteria bacterium]
MRTRRNPVPAALLFLLANCGAGAPHVEAPQAAAGDSGADAGTLPAHTGPTSPADAGPPGPGEEDAGTVDAGAGVDAGTADAGFADAGTQTLAERCFPHMRTLAAPAPDYGPTGLDAGTHCLGTNHQDIAGIQQVVFVGDSVTAGVPNAGLNLVQWGFPVGAGTPSSSFYRNQVADALAAKFGLAPPNLLWREVNPSTQKAALQSSGAFHVCAKWGSRMGDVLGQLQACLPQSLRSKKTLIVMTAGGNDLSNMTSAALNGATRAQLEQRAAGVVAELEAVLAWVKAPGRFPAGVALVFGNVYEYTDGTNQLSACPGAQAINMSGPLPDPAGLSDVVFRMQESFARAAVQHGVDITWMYEQFCGHGWRSDSPTAPCYRGPGAARFF